MTTHRPVAALPTCSKCGDPLEAFQPWSAAILFCPRCNPSKARPVTGPDGDNPITDEQIRELRRLERSDGNRINVEICDAALGELRGARGQVVSFVGGEIDDARARCAAAYNARHAGEEGQ